MGRVSEEYRKFTFELLTGDTVTRPVFTKDGQILVGANTTLTHDAIKQLERFGIEQIWVKEDESASAAKTSGPDTADPPPAATADAPLFSLGSLEGEDPIVWDEIAAAAPDVERPAEQIEKELEERAVVRPALTRTPVTPPPFVYDRAEVKEAKKVVLEVHRRTLKETRKAVAAIGRRDHANLDGLHSMIIQLVDTGLSNKQVLSALTSLSHFDDYLLAHAVTSTVYAILTGYMMGLSQTELYELGEACLLHDIGMSRVPSAIWQKPAALARDEMLEIQKHTIFGADILHEIKGVSFMAELVAYQHHERHDGSGYPKGRKGISIGEYARIVGMVDVYAAMTADRPHREKMLGYDAMNHILASSSTLFDPTVVKAFLRSMALYPIGSLVELSNGATGIVVAANALFPYRPHVKITKDEKGVEAGEDGDIVDLLAAKELGIVRPLAAATATREQIWKAF
jgi:HD-GYP domain-containing protein (c-di-GMP phosphodiesterase class II)